MIDGLFLPGQLVQFGGGILPTVLLSDTPAAEYSFNLTSGDSGFGAYGYNSPEDILGVGPFGSIDAEPIPGASMLIFVDGIGVIGFTGDQMAVLAGKTVWVDGVEYPFDNDWEYDEGEDATAGQWLDGGPSLPVRPELYAVKIK